MIRTMTPRASLKDSLDPIREFIQAEMVGRVLPSLAVAVAHQGEIIWEEGLTCSP